MSPGGGLSDALLRLLVDPLNGTPLRWSDGGGAGGGRLLGGDGRSYPVVGGIPRFVDYRDGNQEQTSRSFGYKWGQRDTYESPAMLAQARAWLQKRHGFASLEALRDYFAGRRSILDAGCGSGFSASLWMDPGWRGGTWVGADISEAIDVAKVRLGWIPGTSFVQADILNLPFPAGAFDTIFSEGVMHHTPSTERALKALARHLSPGGDFLFYVYRKKAPLREFADDHIRAIVSALPPEAAWEALRPLTRLGQALAELNVQVDVPEDVPLLGIKAGRHDIQRLIYWHFAKMFWSAPLSLEENNHVNFDWYHPRYAHRQTEEEVRRWCAEAGLDIRRFDLDDAGFTVRATRT